MFVARQVQSHLLFNVRFAHNSNVLKIKSIFGSKDILGKVVTVQGLIRTVREQKKFSFLELNDGSTLHGIQAVIDCNIPTYASMQQIKTGAAVELTGVIVTSPAKGQSLELAVSEVKVIGECSDDYPLQKKRHSLEFLRTISHLRPRTNTLSAVSRVRSTLAFGTHSFFQNEGFTYVQTPLITTSDCEGGGEMFRVTTLPLDKSPSHLPVAEGNVDFTKDFFGKPAYLTVSGQLSGEAYSAALGDIYTFGPTFRAENSQSTRHLAEFHMIEPEMAFCDMHSAMDNAEKYLKCCVENVVTVRADDLQFLAAAAIANSTGKNNLEKLERLVKQPFARVSYEVAIALLQEEIAKDKAKWQFPDLIFGSDLSTEHERWLAENKFNGCVFVHNYPRKIKSFYMKDSASDGGATVDCFDLLVPGVGELLGGSQREHDHDTLLHKMTDFGLQPEHYWWYLELRKYGSSPHSGYGVGFERLVAYVCGLDNIRDAIAFPRFANYADF